jgi:hypothetical protein
MWIKQDPKYLDDPRLAKLTERAQLRFHQLYMLAGRCEASGAFIIDGRRLDDDDLAFHLRVRDKRLFKVDLKALRSAKLIVVNGHGPVIADWKQDQVDIEEIRAARRERDKRYEERKRRGDDGDASDARRRLSGDGYQSQSPDQNPELESRVDQPTTLPSSRTRRADPGGQAGGKTQKGFDHLKPKERKRAQTVAAILGAASLRQPKLNQVSVLVATRISVRTDDLMTYLLAALASAYADQKANNKVAVAAHRIEQDRVSPEFKDPSRWKSIPVDVLKAAGIKDLDQYVTNSKYRR